MENEIKEFFRQTAPKPSDPTAFRLELNARLAAVESIKAYHDREVRRLRRIRRLTFVAGLLLGGAAAAWFILHPVRLPELPLDTRLPEGASTVGASLISWGVACLVVGLAIFIPLRSLRRQRKPLF